MPVNFTSSNAPQAPNPRSGFENYDVPERIPFSQTALPEPNRAVAGQANEPLQYA